MAFTVYDPSLASAGAAHPRSRQATLLGRFFAWARAHAPGAGRWLARAGARLRTLVLTFAGLASVVAGVAQVFGAGWALIAAGPALLGLEYLSTPETDHRR